MGQFPRSLQCLTLAAQPWSCDLCPVSLSIVLNSLGTFATLTENLGIFFLPCLCTYIVEITDVEEKNMKVNSQKTDKTLYVINGLCLDQAPALCGVDTAPREDASAFQFNPMLN